jgi:ubiquilin
MSSDLFQDGGVIKTTLRPSSETIRPKQGDEVALTYVFTNGVGEHLQNLVYTVGSGTQDLFLPVRTLDRIVCEMRRNEKCRVKISSSYSGRVDDFIEVDITLLHIRASASSSSGRGLNSLEGNLGDLQSHLMRNPDVMDQMISSPFMQSLMNNPETLRSILGTNPQMQELLRQNPELNSMINDPQFLQQTAEAMRNPAMMREMMRNTDRAMSNIESLPGGSAALHKLYNEIQAPLYEASQAPQGQLKKISDKKELTAKYGSLENPKRPVAEPMTNPWAKSTARIPTPVVPNTIAGPVDMSAMAQMMQDPSLQQFLGSSIRQEIPRSAGFNPAALQQLFSPTTMQSMGRLERSLESIQHGQQSSQSSQESFSSVFRNFLTDSQLDPRSRFRQQIEALREMGFTDMDAVVKALQETNGNIDEAAVKLATESECAESTSKK